MNEFMFSMMTEQKQVNVYICDYRGKACWIMKN